MKTKRNAVKVMDRDVQGRKAQAIKGGLIGLLFPSDRPDAAKPITVTGTGGTFTLTFNGQTTAADGALNFKK